ncbi:acyl-coenzyme A thioesterase 2, mitochondrial-like [Haliotis rufescens]|uniref:acyl-coenzyme A thioesterase 2, mitochondrial-like n=1 Tax=Haliotis rufescens TaxID=6454 RepID=UPI00201F1339|nr:acyl-coenzyme A thioesterase 2, mitochondrial-like [Haliotis rufescens]
MVCLNISPRVALVDERISITANNLRPLQRVTVQAWVEEGKAVFSSCGHFLADQQGQIHVSQHNSVGGTYKGVDNMGLFWSMNPVPGVSLQPILRKVDVMTPLVFRLSVMDDHIPFDDLQLPSSVVLATGELQRCYKHRTVRRIEVHVGSLRGTIFLPEGKGPFPGVLDMFGSTGGLVEFRAALLASRGFVSFALAYFNYDDLPSSLADVDFDYLLDAVHWLASHPHVKPGGIGVVGSSKGGEMAFLLGMATDKAWKNNAQILYLLGDDDAVWNTDHANTFVRSCPEEKRKNINLVTYPGGGHLIEPPYMPLYRAMYHPLLGSMVVMGGHPEAHAAAQEDAWRRLLHFIQKHVA